MGGGVYKRREREPTSICARSVMAFFFLRRRRVALYYCDSFEAQKIILAAAAPLFPSQALPIVRMLRVLCILRLFARVGFFDFERGGGERESKMKDDETVWGG